VRFQFKVSKSYKTDGRCALQCPTDSRSFPPCCTSTAKCNCAGRDLPPAGGFESVKYKRNLPLRGPGALVILGGVSAVCAFGFWRIGSGNVERRCVISSHVRAAEMRIRCPAAKES
jgi:hypothetical protein